MGARAASFCLYISESHFCTWLRSQDFLGGKHRKKNPRQRTSWLEGLVAERPSSTLCTLCTSTMQYTCDCRPCDVWTPREGSRSAFHRSNEVGLLAGSAVWCPVAEICRRKAKEKWSWIGIDHGKSPISDRRVFVIVAGSESLPSETSGAFGGCRSRTIRAL